MKYGSLVLEKRDFVMIKRYQHLYHYVEDYAHKYALEALEENMPNARVYGLDDMPDDVVRMYSMVTVTYKSRWQETFQLVPPMENDVEQHKISVRSTLGASVIGLSEGDSIKYGLPGDIVSLKIEKVTQSAETYKVNIPEETLENALPKHCKVSLTLNI